MVLSFVTYLRRKQNARASANAGDVHVRALRKCKPKRNANADQSVTQA